MPSVAIVGAGMGGLATAGALGHLGIEVDVYEQAAQFSRVGAGIQLTPNAIKALRTIGLEPRVRDRSYETYSQLTRHGVTGEVIRELVMPAEAYGAPYVCMHRAELHAALAGAVPAERLHLGKRLVGLDQGGSRGRLSFADGSAVAADVIVGADGMHSVVREHIVGPVSAVYNGRSSYRSVLAAERIDRDLGHSRTLWIAGDRHVLTYHTLPDRSEICFATGQPDSGEWITRESWSAKGALEDLRATFAEFHPDVLAVLDACTECHITGMSYLEPLARWSDGRAVLVGDACHTMAPRMAQGATMAIEDAVVLARCLADVGDEDVEGAFARYERHRKPRTSLVHQIAADPQAAVRRGERDMGWLYRYEAWTVPLDEPPIQPDTIAAAV